MAQKIFRFAVMGVILFLVAGVYAGTEIPDEIRLDNPAYKKHKYGIVIFTHKLHMQDYASKYLDLYPNACGECHHDEDNKPLSDLKEGDSVQSCMECHSKPSQKPKGKKMTKEEKRQYHAEAIHDNCRGCHRAFRKLTGEKTAPTTRKKCHPKKS